VSGAEGTPASGPRRLLLLDNLLPIDQVFSRSSQSPTTKVQPRYDSRIILRYYTDTFLSFETLMVSQVFIRTARTANTVESKENIRVTQIKMGSLGF
jgi:hypothetical protein